MLEVRSITAHGLGRCGGIPFRFALVTTETTWTDSAGARSATRRTWEVHAPRPVGDRVFVSEEERDRFLATTFTDLDLDGESWAEPQPGGHPLAGLLHARLDAVHALDGVIDMRFGGLHLRLHTPPDMQRGGVTEAGVGTGRLRGLLGARLTGVDELLDLGLVLDFDEGTRLMVDLSEGPSPIAEFSGNGHVWGPRALPV